MEEARLTVTCQGATTVNLEELQDFQGNLKDLTEENYVKLRNSMMTYGISFPFFIWIDENGAKWIIDAHQRARTLRKMRDEGHVIPPLPADFIYADSREQAKKKLLLLNSRYGKITQEGWDEFTGDIDIDDMSDMLEIPEMDHNYEEEETDEKPKVAAGAKSVACPHCGQSFEI